MIIQKLQRVYPEGWTGNSKRQLNDLLEQGWHVKMVTDMGKGVHDYILERDDTKRFLIEHPSLTDEDIRFAIHWLQQADATTGFDNISWAKSRSVAIIGLRAILGLKGLPYDYIRID